MYTFDIEVDGKIYSDQSVATIYKFHRNNPSLRIFSSNHVLTYKQFSEIGRVNTVIHDLITESFQHSPASQSILDRISTTRLSADEFLIDSPSPPLNRLSTLNPVPETEETLNNPFAGTLENTPFPLRDRTLETTNWDSLNVELESINSVDDRYVTQRKKKHNKLGPYPKTGPTPKLQLPPQPGSSTEEITKHTIPYTHVATPPTSNEMPDKTNTNDQDAPPQLSERGPATDGGGGIGGDGSGGDGDGGRGNGGSSNDNNEGNPPNRDNRDHRQYEPQPRTSVHVARNSGYPLLDYPVETRWSFQDVTRCIKPWNGEADTCYVFIRDCDKAFASTHPNDHQRLFWHITSKLDAVDHEWFSACEFKCWPELKQYIQSSILDVHPPAVELANFSTLKQGNNESVKDYYKQVLGLWRRFSASMDKHPGQNEHLHECALRSLLEYMIRGSRDDFNIALVIKAPPTIAAAYKEMKRIEELRGNKTVVKPAFNNPAGAVRRSVDACNHCQGSHELESCPSLGALIDVIETKVRRTFNDRPNFAQDDQRINSNNFNNQRRFNNDNRGNNNRFERNNYNNDNRFERPYNNGYRANRNNDRFDRNYDNRPRNNDRFDRNYGNNLNRNSNDFANRQRQDVHQYRPQNAPFSGNHPQRQSDSQPRQFNNQYRQQNRPQRQGDSQPRTYDNQYPRNSFPQERAPGNYQLNNSGSAQNQPRNHYTQPGAPQNNQSNQPGNREIPRNGIIRAINQGDENDEEHQISPFVLVDVYGRFLHALIDTGATVSLISRKCINHSDINTRTWGYISGIGGPSQTYGTAAVNVKCDNLIMTPRMVVVHEDVLAPFEMFIGTDIIMDYGLKIDLRGGTVSGDSFKTSLYRAQFHKPNLVYQACEQPFESFPTDGPNLSYDDTLDAEFDFVSDQRFGNNPEEDGWYNVSDIDEDDFKTQDDCLIKYRAPSPLEEHTDYSPNNAYSFTQAKPAANILFVTATPYDLDIDTDVCQLFNEVPDEIPPNHCLDDELVVALPLTHVKEYSPDCIPTPDEPLPLARALIFDPPTRTLEKHEPTPVEKEIDETEIISARNKLTLSLQTEFKNVFGELEPTPSEFLKPFEIEIKEGAKPTRSKIYRFSPNFNDFVKREINDLLEKQIIEPSSSPFSAPVWIVDKKSTEAGHKNYRMVIDFRKLNEITVFESYPIPRIEEILDLLGQARYFSIMDLVSGYHQIPIKPEDRHKTAFTAFNELWQFKRIPFGLCNAAQFFQRTMNDVLRGLLGKICYAYLDDIIVYGRSIPEHNENLRQVFERLNHYKLKVKLSKCSFLTTEFSFLGHKLTPREVGMEASKINALHNLQPPTNLKRLRSFLGMIGFYRRFIMNFSLVAEPLFRLMRKGIKFAWDEKCHQAFTSLIRNVSEDVTLSFPDYGRPFHLTTDACEYGAGAVLSQVDDQGFHRPLNFQSTLFNAAEKNYSTTEKECLAIIWAIKTYRHYLLSTHFFIYTDHKALVWLKDHADTTSRLFRWQNKLMEYSYTIKYQAGRDNKVADELSRNFDENEIQKATRTLGIVNAVQGAVEADDLENISLGSADTDGEIAEEPDELTDRDPDNTRELITDDDRIQQIIEDVHSGPIGGHRGIVATKNIINFYFDIPNLQERVSNFIKNCDPCQRNKYSRQNRRLPMALTTTYFKPNEKIAFDVVGPFKYPNDRKHYALTIQDDFTKMTKFCGISNCTADAIAKAFIEEWILNFGIPRLLLSDNAPNLCGEIMTAICRLLGIRKLSMSICHPQSNAGVERSHAKLCDYVRCTEKELEEDVDWFMKMKLASYCFNTTPSQSTGFSPFELMFGSKPRLISAIGTGQPLITPEGYVEKLKRHLDTIWNSARSNMIDSKLKAIQREADSCQRRVLEDFKVGQWVLVETKVFKGKSNRTSPIFLGPFKIAEVGEHHLNIHKRNRITMVNKSNCKIDPKRN